MNKRHENRRVEIQLTYSIEKNKNEIQKHEVVSDKEHLDRYFDFSFEKTQYFTIFGSRDTTLVTQSGSVFIFKANTFKLVNQEKNDEIKVGIIECFTLGDMLLSNLSTTSNDEPLQTMGMFHISATQNIDNKEIGLKLNDSGAITTYIPVQGADQDMEIFTGKRAEWGNINWNRTNQTAQNSGLVYLNASSLFDCWLSNVRMIPAPCPFFFCKIKMALNPKKYKQFPPSAYQVDCMNLLNRLATMGSTSEDFLRTHYSKIMDSLNITDLSVLRDTLNSINRRNREAYDKSVLDGLDNGTANLENATYLVFRNSNLGWANLDKFQKLKPTELTKLNLPEQENGSYNFKLIFPKERVIYPSVQENERKHRFISIPKNTKAILVGIGFQLGQLVLCIKNINTNDRINRIEFKETTSDELKKQIQALEF